MYFPAIHAIQKERREQQGIALCVLRRTHDCMCPSLFHTMCLVKHSRNDLYSMGIYASCPIFCEKKVHKLSIHECLMWSIGVFGRARSMMSKTNYVRCHGNPYQSKGWSFFMQTFVHLWWPSTRTSSVSGVEWGLGRVRIISEWKLIYFGSNAWLLKFHLKALNPLRKIDGKHEIKDAFHICLTDEIWSVRPPCNVFNKMSTRENNTTSNHKKIFF